MAEYTRVYREQKFTMRWLELQCLFVIAGILVAEYALMYMLRNMSEMALLAGSLTLFLIIAAAMYFTLRLKLENDKLQLK